MLIVLLILDAVDHVFNLDRLALFVVNESAPEVL